MTQPTALYLAQVLENPHGPPLTMSEGEAIAAELRRLVAQRDTLLKSMKLIERVAYDAMTAALARTAIAAVEEKK